MSVLVDLIPRKDGLEIRLHDEQARAELADLLEQANHFGYHADTVLAEVLEPYLCNGWAFVPPETIGALTEAPILTDSSTDTNDEGTIIPLGNLYAYMDYQIFDPVAQIIREGKIFLPVVR